MGDLKCREVKSGFCGRDKCKPVLLRLSLAGNLEKPLMSLYGTEWRERGYGLRSLVPVGADEIILHTFSSL
jgi:hypothetical protein